MYTKDSIGPVMEFLGTPALKFIHEEFWPFSITLCFRLNKNIF